jgi:hypothetical protein
VGDKIPQEYLVKKDNLNLEDVYLFYTKNVQNGIDKAIISDKI